MHALDFNKTPSPIEIYGNLNWHTACLCNSERKSLCLSQDTEHFSACFTCNLLLPQGAAMCAHFFAYKLRITAHSCDEQ
jgi:hypothetical protein